ncbi:hypothetical protein ASC95_18095 [Pelomonas sp. Root1217]|uniref:hypothetical protein n=1 Tax=Pelomonas sp. Root1217 TaxID=1736430 RepID=UPI000715F6A3|nr:hypothetical protein [Pelomonas sp. Root1217]KQV49505.1 hypothetical protein ASC95_18095 [Pelomonas sp. Root1217]
MSTTSSDDRAQFDVLVSDGITRVLSNTAELRVNAASNSTPVSGHPRLWLRQDDLARLRSWATASNPMFGTANSGGLMQLATTAANRVENGTVPGQDNGGSTYTPYATESYAALLAFMSLVDTDPTRNARWVQTARRALFSVIDEADKGVGSGKFRSDSFASSDRGRWSGESFPLAVDWIYPTLSAAEKQKVRRVFLRWCAEDRDGYPSATYFHTNPGSLPAGAARRNSPALLDLGDPRRQALRYSMNNYFMAHGRNMFMMANVIDAADDRADPAVAGDSNGALRDYMHEATGTYLYMSDAAYRGDGSGGISPEGMEYGESIGFYYGLMLAIHTSGMDNTQLYGEKVQLRNHPLFSRVLPSFFHSLTTQKVKTPYGEAYQPSWFGDAEQLYLQDPMRVMGPLALAARYLGNSAELNAAKWLQYTAPPNHPSRLVASANNDDNIVRSIFYFLTFDPTQAVPSDPRSNLPLAQLNSGVGRFQGRTSWNDAAEVRMLDFKLGYNTIDHQHGDGNGFDFWRKGEWITKELSAYGSGAALSEFKNTLVIQNNPAAAVGSYHAPFLARGSQFILGMHDGDPRILSAGSGDGFMAVNGDATNLYNARSGNAKEVTHASRSMLWIQPDALVVFDRARTSTDNRFKRFMMMLPSGNAAPQVMGDRVYANTPGGQRLEVRTLLPQSQTTRVAVEGPVLPLSDQMWKASLDPMSADKTSWTGGYRLRVEDTVNPRNQLFLHVLQAFDANATAAPTVRLQSHAGTDLTGVVVGTTAVLFTTDLGVPPVAGTAVRLPSGVQRVMVSGLNPGTSWTVTLSPSANETVFSLAPNGGLSVGSHGVLAVQLGQTASASAARAKVN